MSSGPAGAVCCSSMASSATVASGRPGCCACVSAAFPFVAVNLEPVFCTIDAYVPTVEAAVSRLEASTGRAPLLVCHSMGVGGCAWLQAHQADHRIFRVVTIGTPHHGTWMARFGLAPNTRQMRQLCEWLDSLARKEPPNRLERFRCYYGHATTSSCLHRRRHCRAPTIAT